MSTIDETGSPIVIEGPGAPPVLAPDEPTLEEREPDELEQHLAGGMEGIDSVRIEGPGGTTGADAINAVVGNALGGDAIFDPSPYTNAPQIDGQTADMLKLAFSGGTAYEATDDIGRKLFDKFELGHEYELRVGVTVVTKTGRYKRSADDVETVTGQVGLKVGDVWVLTAEEL